MKFSDLTNSQVWAQARQYITFAAGIAATLGFISATQQGIVVDNVDQVVTGLKEIIGGLVTVAGAVTLIINTFKANKAASPASAVQRVQEIASAAPSVKSDAAKVELIAATNAIPEVKGVVMNPVPEGVKLAEAVPAPTVVPAGTVEAEIIAKGGRL